MAEQHSIGKKAECFRDDGLCRHRTELSIDQADIVAVIDQWPANREQAQRWQVVVRNPAADRRMRHVDQENAHLATDSRPVQELRVAGRQTGVRAARRT